jgi:hypothetical protein
MTNKMSPANAIAPTSEKRIIVDKGNGEIPELDGFDPEKLRVIDERIRSTYTMPIITGIRTAIKLAVKPNFLPDSNDIFTKAVYVAFLG